MKVKSTWLRQIHKWVGLVIGLQFLLWAVSGLAMALLDMQEVAGGAMAEGAAVSLPARTAAWPRIQAQLQDDQVSGLAARMLTTGTVIEVTTSEGIRLFEPGTGDAVTISAPTAGAIASAAHPDHGPVARISQLGELNLAVRDHELPIWQVEFGDGAGSTYYVSGTTGELLERRNDSWRWWDFFWMLHNMDYAQRTSFNHPLIVIVTFATLWLSVTGFWLLFRSFRAADFAWLRRTR